MVFGRDVCVLVEICRPKYASEVLGENNEIE